MIYVVCIVLPRFPRSHKPLKAPSCLANSHVWKFDSWWAWCFLMNHFYLKYQWYESGINEHSRGREGLWLNSPVIAGCLNWFVAGICDHKTVYAEYQLVLHGIPHVHNVVFIQLLVLQHNGSVSTVSNYVFGFVGRLRGYLSAIVSRTQVMEGFHPLWKTQSAPRANCLPK